MILDWDDAYANRAYFPGTDACIARWGVESARFRAQAACRLDIPYGDGPRQRLDLFLPTGTAAGLVVFVHGGYWRSFAKDDWSHLARGAVARGWAVAIPGYDLCPAVTIPQITRQIEAAISTASDLVPGPIRLAGHSAGGHLVTRMACTDLSPGFRPRIAMTLSLSGVHDLRPMRRTAMNDDLRLTEAQALAESPALLTCIEGTRLSLWVGADERPEFIRQSHLLANVWTGCAADTAISLMPGKNHFTLIDDLENPASAMVQALLG